MHDHRQWMRVSCLQLLHHTVLLEYHNITLLQKFNRWYILEYYAPWYVLEYVLPYNNYNAVWRSRYSTT